mmetsp:Transcript_17581/g.45933  ORF Transcript_17581/g.45933 Transcript_17581/m.45933 type:complete len:230 (-) Transcript_17581:519-1208(-)
MRFSKVEIAARSTSSVSMLSARLRPVVVEGGTGGTESLSASDKYCCRAFTSEKPPVVRLMCSRSKSRSAITARSCFLIVAFAEEPTHQKPLLRLRWIDFALISAPTVSRSHSAATMDGVDDILSRLPKCSPRRVSPPSAPSTHSSTATGCGALRAVGRWPARAELVSVPCCVYPPSSAGGRVSGGADSATGIVTLGWDNLTDLRLVEARRVDPPDDGAMLSSRPTWRYP